MSPRRVLGRGCAPPVCRPPRCSPPSHPASIQAMRIAVYAPSELLSRPATLYIIVNHGGLVGKDGRIYIRGDSFNHNFLLER